jgi:AcrR family transcriptional regulator
MSPQPSNRQNLIDGTIRCLERLPAARITSRAIAAEADANLASIGYHFGSKDRLLTTAVIEALDHWLEEIERELEGLEGADPDDRLRAAADVFERTRTDHEGLARNFIGALARAQHEPPIRELLAAGFRRTRPSLAAALGLGDDQAGEDAAGLVHSMFVGLLAQILLEPDLAITGGRFEDAQVRLGNSRGPRR